MFNRLSTALIAAGMMMSTGAIAATPARSGDVLVRGVLEADRADVLRTIVDEQAALRSGGRKALMSRLSFAINSLCEESVSAVTDPVGALRCHDAAWAQARAQINRPTLALR